MCKILFAGDFSPRFEAKTIIENNNSLFDDVEVLCKSVDYSIVNLECPIVNRTEEFKPLYKCGPHLWNTPTALHALKAAGFSCVTLANNHIKDFSGEGVLSTITHLDEDGLKYVGAGKNIYEAKRPLFLNLKDEICFINCCESEYSIATEDEPGANPLDLVAIYNEIISAKKSCKYVIVITHSGVEGYQLPTPRMQKNYRFFIDAGADAVINCHQHCFSGYERYREGVIFYGLGNFYFDDIDADEKWCQGYMVCLDLDNLDNFEIHPYRQCYDKLCSFSFLSGNNREDFYVLLEKLNKVIQSSRVLISEFNAFADSHEEDYADSLFPFKSRGIRYLHRKGLIPDMLSKDKWLYLRDMFTCESHFDRYLRMINKKVNK